MNIYLLQGLSEPRRSRDTKRPFVICGLSLLSLLVLGACSDNSAETDLAPPPLVGPLGQLVQTFDEFRIAFEQTAQSMAADRSWLTATLLEDMLESGVAMSQISSNYIDEIEFDNTTFEANLQIFNANKTQNLIDNIATETFGIMIDPDFFYVRSDDAETEYDVPVYYSDGRIGSIEVPDESDNIDYKSIRDGQPVPILVLTGVEQMTAGQWSAAYDEQYNLNKDGLPGGGVILSGELVPYVTAIRIRLSHEHDISDEEFELFMGSLDDPLRRTTIHIWDGETRNDARPNGPAVRYNDVNRRHIYNMDEEVYLARIGGIEGGTRRILCFENDAEPSVNRYKDGGDHHTVRNRAYRIPTNTVTDQQWWHMDTKEGKWWGDDDDRYMESGVQEINEGNMLLALDVNPFVDTENATNHILEDVNFRLGMKYWQE